MSCFKLLGALCDELTIMIRNFWWGQKEEDKNSSFYWHSIMSAQNLVREGV